MPRCRVVLLPQTRLGHVERQNRAVLDGATQSTVITNSQSRLNQTTCMSAPNSFGNRPCPSQDNIDHRPSIWSVHYDYLEQKWFSSSAQWPEEGLNVLRERLRLFHRGKMPPFCHDSPLTNVGIGALGN